MLESASRAGALLANHREVTALIRTHGRVAGDEEDFAYLLEAANHTLPDAHVDSTHIVASWAGLRPRSLCSRPTNRGAWRSG